MGRNSIPAGDSAPDDASAATFHSIRDRFPFKRYHIATSTAELPRSSKTTASTHKTSRSHHHKQRKLSFYPFKGKSRLYLCIFAVFFVFSVASMVLQSSIMLAFRQGVGGDRMRWRWSVKEGLERGSSLEFVPRRPLELNGSRLDSLRIQPRIGVRPPRIALILGNMKKDPSALLLYSLMKNLKGLGYLLKPSFFFDQIMATASALPNLHPMMLRLDRNNYSFWRMQVLTTVRAHGFDDLISSTMAPPPLYLPPVAGAPPAENPAYLQWIRKDQFLMSWMLSSIGESMLGHIVRCSSSSEIWKTLEQLFQSQSRARILQLKRQLHTQKKGSLSVDEFFLKMRNIADQLSATGHAVRDEDLGDFILSGFGPEYEAVVINLLHRSEPSNLQEMQFALQSHEIRLQQNFLVLSDPAAHFVQRGGGRGFRGRGASSGRSGQFRPSFGKTSSVVCQICQRSGHVAIKCYKRFDVHFTQAVNTNPQAYVTDMQNAAEFDYDEEEGVWYVDSGATNHVTNSVHNLQLQSPYHGSEALTVGNGQENQPSSAEGQSSQGTVPA